jgi:HD-GYP domain-containing protein (c-di-GMP phosphodiesterase class II)
MVRLVIATEEVQPLWIVDEDILSAAGQPLVLRGAVVTPSLKAAMIRHGIERVRVRPDQEEADLDWRPGEVLPAGLVLRARQKVQKLFDDTARRRSLSPRLLDAVVEQTGDIVNRLFEGPLPLFAELRSLARFDDYTHEHSWSVLLLSLALARAAQEKGLLKALTYQDRLTLGVGAVLHDIGKASLPRSLLQKPGPLDEEEWKQMRLHPQKGIDLLRPYDSVMPLSRAIVAFHHERPDGRGYGLAKGSTLQDGHIPELVRLVAIADAYDAMVSSRPYRRARLPFEALDVLKAEGGRQFDEDLAPLMADIVVAFPAGSLLLADDGSVITVLSPGDTSGRGSLPEGLVVATFSERSRGRLGQSLRLGDRSSLLFGAASPEDLAATLLEEGSQDPVRAALDSYPPRLVAAAPLWDELLAHALAREEMTLSR